MNFFSKFRPNRREQLFCIRPKDKVERHKFWVSRCQQGETTLLYIAILQAIVFVADFIFQFPTDWNAALIKLITLLWTAVYLAIWLVSLRFPTKYTYTLPLVIMAINTITMCYWYLGVVTQEEQTPALISRNFAFCSLAQMWDTLFLVCFVAPSFGSLFSILIADAVLRVIHHQLVWKNILDDSTWAMELITFVYFSFIAIEIVLFMFLQKRELASYFSYRDLE